MAPICINPACSQPSADNPKSKPASHLGMCRTCRMAYTHLTMPSVGFISTGTLRALGRELQVHLSLTASDLSSALRLSRGLRYPRGPWPDRPPVQMLRLWHGKTIKERLPHMLNGRRSNPTTDTLFAAIIHYHLARRVIIPGVNNDEYARFLAGATWMGRRAVLQTPGHVDTAFLKGEHREVRRGYKLTQNDLKGIGRFLMDTAGKPLGLRRDHRQIADWLEGRYYSHLSDDSLKGRVVVHPMSAPTKHFGDHILDHFVSPEINSPYTGQVRRHTGNIKGLYPIGLDYTCEDAQPGLGTLKPYGPHQKQITSMADVFNKAALRTGTSYQ